MLKIQMISIISFLSFSVIIGTLVFSRGFLLNRQIVPDKAGPCLDTSYHHPYHLQRDHDDQFIKSGQHELLSNLSEAASWCNRAPVFKKAILILVDALRNDFVDRMRFLSKSVKVEDSQEALFNKTSKTFKAQGRTLHKNTDTNGRFGTEHKNNDELHHGTSCLFRFVADPPTTTMQRLKALMTGTMPTFIDASANFNSYEIEEDSLIYQLQAIGKKTAFLGDDTWLSLFPKSFFQSPFVEAHPSFNAWDLDTVDRAVNHTLRTKIFSSQDAEDQWDVLIAHLLGVDHCGHRYGPNHPEMKRKLDEADEIIEFVYNSMSSDTLLVVFGDHGMTHTGDHGGDSKDERDSAIVFLTKVQKRNGYVPNSGFQCPSYNSGISQIDLVPTLATILGIPIPYSSIGQLIPNFLSRKDLYTDAVAANAAQVERYLKRFGIGANNNYLQQDFEKLQEAFHTFQLSRTNQSARVKFTTLAHKYMNQVKYIAQSTWTQFNVPMIYTGIVITSLAELSLFVYLVNVPTLLSSKRKYKYSVLSWLWPSLPLWSVFWTFVKQSPSPSTSLVAIIVSTISGLVMFLFALVVKLMEDVGSREEEQRLVSKKRRRKKQWKYCDVGALLLYMLSCLAVFSNSFVINEAYVLGSALLLVVFLHIVTGSASSAGVGVRREPLLHHVAPAGMEESVLFSILERKNVRCSTACFFVLAILVRSCSIFFRCREELVQCTEEYLLHKQLASLPEEWLVHKYVRYSIGLLSLAILIVAFRLWMLYEKCFFSKTTAAIVAKISPSLLVVLLGVFWALQGLPIVTKIPIPSIAKLRPIINYFPWAFQVSTFISLVLVWFKPMLVSVNALALSNYRLCCSRCTHIGVKKTKGDPISTMTPSTVLPSTGVRNTVTNSSSWNKDTQMSPKISQSKVNSNASRKLNGLNKYSEQSAFGASKTHQPKEQQKQIHSSTKSGNKSVYVNMDPQQQFNLDDVNGAQHMYCSFIMLGTLIIILMTHVTSVGIAPAVTIIIPYCIICLVGIYRNPSSPMSLSSNYCEGSSWCSVVAWTLASQYMFYGTGHQPIFSAIPWDSAFISTTDGNSFADSSGSWMTWLRPVLTIVGNLHVSQIIFSLAVPLLAFWNCSSPLLHHVDCRSLRKKAYVLSGKYVFLHGLKLLACMMCAGWHRRHLMVWKIFAPKLIFEAISFIVTTFTVMFSLVFMTKIDYLYHRNRHKGTQVRG